MCGVEERDARSSDFLKVNIIAQGGNVFAPIFHNVHGASGITLTQSVAGKACQFNLNYSCTLNCKVFSM